MMNLRSRTLTALHIIMLAAFISGCLMASAGAETIIRKPLKVYGLGKVNAAAWSPDGKKVAAASNGVVAIFNPTTGERLSSLFDQNAVYASYKEPKVNAIAFSRDGKLLATGNSVGEAKVWDLATGNLRFKVACKAPLAGYVSLINGVAFSPDGKYLLTGSGDWMVDKPRSTGALKLWNVSNGALYRTFSSTSFIKAVDYSSTGGNIVTADENGVVCLWSASSNKLVRYFEGPYNCTAYDVAFSHDGKKVVAAFGSLGTYLWNTSASPALHAYPATFPNYVYAVDFASNGQCFVAGGYMSARLWSSTGRYGLLRTYTTLGPGDAKSLSFSPDSSSAMLLAASNNIAGGEVKILNSGSGRVIRTFHGHDRGVYSLAASKDSRWLLSGADTYGAESAWESGAARVYDLKTGAERFLLPGTGGSANVDITTDSKYLVTATFGSGLKIWNASGSLVREIKERDAQNKSVPVCAISMGLASGARRIMIGSSRYNSQTSRYEGIVQIFNFDTGLKEREIGGLDDQVDAIGVGQNLAQSTFAVGTGSYTGKARCFDLNGTLLGLYPYNGLVYAVALSPDGKYVVTGGNGGTIQWDAKTGKLLRYLSSAGRAVAFSPDGRTIAAGDGWSLDSYDGGGYGRVQLWDTATGRPLKTFAAQNATVTSLAFTANGTQLLSGSLDGTIMLWGGVAR